MLRNAGKVVSGVFLRGVVVVLPITMNVAILAWSGIASEDSPGPIIRALRPDLKYWPGLGILLGVTLIFAAGIVVNARIARRLLRYADSLVERIPVVKSIYVSIRDIVAFMSEDTQK